jgi:hypothetical protein
MRMRYIWFNLLTIAILVGAAGCRQPDGPMPEPNAEDQNKIGDVSRDLLAVASRSASAVHDLSEDLSNFAQSNEGARHGAEMSGRLASSLGGTKLSQDAALAMAHDLYIAFRARELSRGQVAKLRENLGAVFAETGVQQNSAERVLEQVELVQADVTIAKRRWWQVF